MRMDRAEEGWTGSVLVSIYNSEGGDSGGERRRLKRREKRKSNYVLDNQRKKTGNINPSHLRCRLSHPMTVENAEQTLYSADCVSCVRDILSSSLSDTFILDIQYGHLMTAAPSQ